MVVGVCSAAATVMDLFGERDLSFFVGGVVVELEIVVGTYMFCLSKLFIPFSHAIKLVWKISVVCG